MSQPETQFATVGNDRVAYQVVGDGPRDVLYTSGLWSHLDIEWEDPGMARFFRRLASFSRLIRFDRRGTGLAVNFGARVMAAAQAGEILVSHTVHGILMGSRYSFDARGVHELKGVPGNWPLYAIEG